MLRGFLVCGVVLIALQVASYGDDKPGKPSPAACMFGGSTTPSRMTSAFNFAPSFTAIRAARSPP